MGRFGGRFSFQASNTSATNTHANLNCFSNEHITKNNAAHQVKVYSGSVIHYSIYPFAKPSHIPPNRKQTGNHLSSKVPY